MATTFKVRENKDYYKQPYTNRHELRYEIVMMDGRKEAATMGYTSSSRAEAEERAAEMQADEDAGVTIDGMLADDRHALNAGLSTELVKYYDDLPARSAMLGKQAAEAEHPWRKRQNA